MSWEVEHIGPHTLYRGDCREVRPMLADVDAIVTDPPYGMHYAARPRIGRQSYNGDRAHHPQHTACTWDHERVDITPWLTYPCVIWGANHYTACLPATNGWLVWYKMGHQGSGFHMSACELGWCSELHTIHYIDHLWHGFKRATQQGASVAHPTEKPIRLMAWSISFLAAPHICDPYMGSGTTGVACVQLGRIFTGIEIERAYFDIACQRMHDALAQPDLFIDQPPRAIQQTLFTGGR